MRKIGALSIFICCCITAFPQNTDGLSAIMAFTGVSSEEELDEYEVERLERLIAHPLRINLKTSSSLKATGLFTPYQIASLEDYRHRHGDVMSLTELAAVDGFGDAFTRRIAPFISVESSGHTGIIRARDVAQEITARSGMRLNEEVSFTYAMKYHIEVGERVTGHLAVAKSADEPAPDSYSGILMWHFRRKAAMLAIGDFNARFGQGLALWNGMSLSGITKPSGFLKRSSFLSPSSSFTGNYAFRGICGEVTLHRFRICAMTALERYGTGYGAMPAMNITMLCRNGQAGITHYADLRAGDSPFHIPDMKTSADLCFTLKGTDLFAEAAYDWVSSSVAALAGVVFRAGEDLHIASVLRYYPSDYNPSHSAAVRSSTRCSNEYGASLSGEFSIGPWIRIKGAEGFGSQVRRVSGALGVDGACFPVPKGGERKSVQIKAFTEMKISLCSALGLKIRLTERIRTWDIPFRTDIRLDCSYYSRLLLLNLRLNAVRSSGTGILSYIEAGIKGKTVNTYIRQGIFFVDSWDDRIYAYERDVPGSFNVPAFYGRGVWTALTGNWKFARWGRIYLRGALTAYPFMKEKKSGRAELKMQLKIDL